MRFFKAFYITGFVTGIVTLLAFVNNVILTRYLGPEGRGEYSIVANLILILALIFGEGIRRSNIIAVGRHPGIAGKQAVKVVLVFVLMLIVAVIIYFTVPVEVFGFLHISSSLVYLGLFATLFIILWRSLQAILLGIQDYKAFNGAQLAYTFLLLIINAAIVFIFNFGLNEIIINFIIVASIVSVYEFVLIQKIKATGIEEEAGSNSSFIFRATFVSVTGFIFLKGDIFIVNYFLDNSSTGIYSITKVIADIFQKLPLILGPIVIARSASNEVKDEVIKISRMSRILIFINIVAIGGTLLLGEWVITTVFSNDFQLSYTLLVYLLPSLVIFSSGHVINAFLMGQGFPDFLLVANLVFAISSVLLNILLLPKLGINAAAFVCSINYTLWAGSFIAYFSVKYKIPLKNMFIVSVEDFIYLKRKIFA